MVTTHPSPSTSRAGPFSAFRPRPDQARILDYVRTGGRMGVSAVPGSGKTMILSCLAAQLVRHRLRGEEEVLIVTFMNSAVDAFSRRIRGFLGAEGLLPNAGYRVRTLHGLGHDIVRERPSLVGLTEDFAILDERAAGQALDEAVRDWIRDHPGVLREYVSDRVAEGRRSWIEREAWPGLVREVAAGFIRRAKDLRIPPDRIDSRLPGKRGDWTLCRMGSEIYADYQRILAHRGAVDFDDLVGLSVDALRSDPDLLARLRERWPYVLEDEAQDSSELQEGILRLLTEGGNWVRVGDPNQAINTTFTTSDLRFLGRFILEPGTTGRSLLHSGRSTTRIIGLANRLVDWTVTGHPHPTVRRRAFTPQRIAPVPEGPGEAANPEDSEACRVVVHPEVMTPGEELDLVAESLVRWLPSNRDRTVAILVPDNRRGARVVEAMRRRKIDCDELLRSVSAIRRSAERLARVLDYLADPLSGARLGGLWEARERVPDGGGGDPDDPGGRTSTTLRRHRRVEDLLWPSGGAENPGGDPEPEEERPEPLRAFLGDVRRWLQASSLPVDQLLLTVAHDLAREAGPEEIPRDLAIAHKLASLMRTVATQNPNWRLEEMAREIRRAAENERQFMALDETTAGYTPRPGRVTVATMHRAKGLEWDRVYLLGVNAYDFPSGSDEEFYRGESWWVADRLNVVEEAKAQLDALHREADLPPPPGDATREARLGYVEERLRLLYVGITRARRELILTANSGNREGDPVAPALPFLDLLEFTRTARAAPGAAKGPVPPP